MLLFVESVEGDLEDIKKIIGSFIYRWYWTNRSVYFADVTYVILLDQRHKEDYLI